MWQLIKDGNLIAEVACRDQIRKRFPNQKIRFKLVDVKYHLYLDEVFYGELVWVNSDRPD